MKHWVRVRQALLLSLVLLPAWILPLFRWDGAVLSAAAISTAYPAQLMHLAAKDNAKVLTENGTSDGAALSLQTLGSDLCLHRGGLTVWERTQTAPFSSW